MDTELSCRGGVQAESERLNRETGHRTVDHAHTLSEESHFVYYLFHEESKDKRIEKSIKNDRESFIIEKMWNDFNVYIKFV